MPDSQAQAIAFLADPATHGGEAPRRIDTHGAIVFLGRERVFKLKRAVRYPYLDYSTVEKRRAACEAEILVNRRSAPALYLGAEPIVRAGGALRLGGPGEAIDWVVVMRRFNEDDGLDRLAERGALTLDHIDALADAVVSLHASAERRVAGAESASLDEIAAENIALLREAAGLDPQAVEAYAQATGGALQATHALRARRREAGLVRRGHGDLHLRNVCLVEGVPTLFDALEFDERLATVDVLYDLAFLLMDLWQRGLETHANRLLNRYLEATRDFAGLAALPLFLSARAAIRAHVAIAANVVSGAAKSLAEASSYLALAVRLLAERAPVLVAIGGLSGTGKTTQARLLAASLGRPPGAVVLRSDVTRKRIAGVPALQRLPAEQYTPAATAAVYAGMAEDAAQCLRAGQAAILDAVANNAPEREAFGRVARVAGVRFAGVWLEAPADVRVQRVEARRNDASDAGADVVRRQLALDAGSIAWTRIAADGSPADVAARVAAAVAEAR